MNKQFISAMNRQWEKTHPKSYKRAVEFSAGVAAVFSLSHIIGGGLSFMIIF